jgi:glycosyltransferase involved in cell wall biosynthesis
MRALVLAVSVAWRQVSDDPRRAAALSHRMGYPRALVHLADRVANWLSGEPHQAAQAWSEGRLTDAIDRLRSQPGLRARRVRRRREQELQGLLAPILPVPPYALRPRAGRLARGKTDGRVLHLVTNALPGKHAGYTLRTQALARAQRDAGLDPHVVTRLGFPVAQGVIDGRTWLEIDGVPYHRLLPTLMPTAGEAVLSRNTQLAAALVEKLRPTVLHAATDYGNGRLAIELGRRYGIPVVYEVRGFLEDTWLTQAPGRSPDAELYQARRRLETYCMREADRVFTLGETMKAEIVDRGVAPEKVIVVPNGVDDDFLQPLPDAAGLRTKLGIAPNDYVVGTVASLTPHEGIGTLLEACSMLRRDGLPVRLLIVGDGPERAGLEAQARRLHLAGSVQFTGRVPHDRVREHHALLDVFAVPRTGDRVCHLVTPLKPVEAMASGLAVAASNVKAMGEIVEPGVNGVLIPFDNPVAWADSLEELFYSPERRRQQGAAARASIIRNRTWRHIADITFGVYRALGAV